MLRNSYVYKALSRTHLVLGIPVKILAIIWSIASFTILGLWVAKVLTWWDCIGVLAIFWGIHNLIAVQFDKDSLIDKIYKIYSTTKDHYHPESRILDRMHERPSKYGRGVRC
jgi:type IV secretory pathway VirB3-like protein